VKTVLVEKSGDNAARVVIDAALPLVGASYTMTYSIHGTGDVIVEASYQPGKENLSMMPRFGTELLAAPGLENLTWYGRGPKETMIDRQFERIGVYQSTVDAEWVEYMRPQENGNKTDVRWVALTNPQGTGRLRSAPSRFRWRRGTTQRKKSNARPTRSRWSVNRRSS
jgi:beta-galactosidase